ncbi:MAG: hypothetical protein ABI853_09085 [Sphingomicrobium sp.]
MKALAILPLLAMAGCRGNVPVTGLPFDPVQFFSGHTQGNARLHTIFGVSHAILVDSRGLPDGRGGLVLDQRVAEQGSAPRSRQWRIHPAGRDRWSGTLSDARGPITILRTNSDVVIRYRMHNGAAVEQHLQVPPSGAVENHMTVSHFGIRLATLDEQIKKLPR